MIAADQPPGFPPELLIGFSSRSDGTMLDRSKAFDDVRVVDRRRRFCEMNGINYDDCVYQRIIYTDEATYQVVVEVDGSATAKYTPGVVADALVTSVAGVGLFLPVADCVATVIYDPDLRCLALLHLGRHSTVAGLLPRVLRRFTDQGSHPSRMLVWMSPSAQRRSYRLAYFADQDDARWAPFCDVTPEGVFLDMQGYNRQQCLDAGIAEDNIFVSDRDTMTDEGYFSHAAGDVGDRMALVVMIKPD